MTMRRRRAWADSVFLTNAFAPSGEIRTDLLAGLTSTETKTVVRIIGGLNFEYAPTDDTEGTNALHIVIGAASREAFDLGTLPDADATADYPTQGWLYATTWLISQTVGATGLHRTNARVEFDLRASRKIDRGVLYMTLLNIASVGGRTLQVTGRVRALCLT